MSLFRKSRTSAPFRKHLGAGSHALLACSLLAAALGATAGETASTDVQALLRATDLSRGGGIPGMVWDLKVANVEQGKLRNTIDLTVEGATHDDKIYGLITFLSPEKYKGQKLLIRDHNMWFGKPGLRKPVPISGRQRLSGSASNADVASSNYVNDYAAVLAGEDTAAGKECTVLDLEAKTDLVSYSRIKYWVTKQDRLGVKAEFFGVSGKKIKTATFDYANKVSHQGKSIPFVSRISIRDDINKQDETTLEISKVRLVEHNLSKFQQKGMIE